MKLWVPNVEEFLSLLDLVLNPRSKVCFKAKHSTKESVVRTAVGKCVEYQVVLEIFTREFYREPINVDVTGLTLVRQAFCLDICKKNLRQKKTWNNIWRCLIFIPKSNTISNSPVFFLQLTWPPFRRLSDTQVSTHPQFLPENQALPNETTPVQNRRVVWEELALEWFWGVHNY